MHFSTLAGGLALAGCAQAWLPKELNTSPRLHPRDLSTGKTLLARDGRNLFARADGQHPRLGSSIKGVNLGSLFVFEPWIASDVWSDMCGSAKSEFDCVSSLGQDTADQKFQDHWKSWITADDFKTMASYGLNTVRIPVGYWMDESLVDSSEHFPRGGMEALANTCDAAANAGLYIIIDQHGAPGAQVENNPDTGQYNPNPGFYTDSNYQRGEKFLTNLTATIHSDTRFRNVGMLEVVNEPEQNSGNDDSMRSQFYPAAQKAIQQAESDAGVSSDNALTVQFMNKDWGAGDPTESIDTANTAYDDHRYIKWAYQQDQSKTGYAKTSCNDDRNTAGLTTVVGEWSMSVADDLAQTDDWKVDSNKDWYAGWFAAQTTSYAKTNGWIFWTWKTSGLNDPRWDYSMAVDQGIIPKDLSGLDSLASSWCSSNQ